MSEEQDRINALPDAILLQILSCLPTKHSIQTSILSKRWINLWKFTPVIDMTCSLQGITESECSLVHNTLSQHQALKLHKFRLEFTDRILEHDLAFWDHDLDFESCIEFAISRQVQILSLLAHLFTEEQYVLPNMLYSHDNIRSLEHDSLKGFSFNPNPQSFRPFGSLKTLCFFGCVIDDETLKGLLSNCPILESLTIDWCNGLLNFKASWCQSMRLKHLVLTWIDELALNVEIDESSLSTFKFHGDLMKISFMSSLPSIVEATIFQWRSRQNEQELEHG